MRLRPKPSDRIHGREVELALSLEYDCAGSIERTYTSLVIA